MQIILLWLYVTWVNSVPTTWQFVLLAYEMNGSIEPQLPKSTVDPRKTCTGPISKEYGLVSSRM